MLNRIAVKRILRKLTGWSEVFLHLFDKNQSARQACIFYYHRVAELGFIDGNFDDRNVAPSLFEKQIAFLSEFAEIVSLPELPQRLAQNKSSNEKPLVSLTFDDGYANFRSNALPILKQYNAPATLSVVTGYMGSTEPAPFDRWAQKNVGRVSPESWRLLNWSELEECVSSGLVTLGSHSHTHSKASECTLSQIQDEVGLSAEILQQRFGNEQSLVYAYPFGNTLLGHVSEDYENAVRAAGFKIAVTTDVGLAQPDSNLLRLPRLEAHNQDSAATLRAKSAGSIAPLYLNEWYHRAFAWKLNPSQSKVQKSPTDMAETGSLSASAIRKN